MRELNTNTLCTSCAGCNRLYNEEFKGIYRCKNYFKMEGFSDDKMYKTK